LLLELLGLRWERKQSYRISIPVFKHDFFRWELHHFKENIKNQLMVFERKVFRRCFGRTKERDGTWSIKTNDELDELIRHKNIINYIKAQRLNWFGNLHRMSE
jgi:hypothetical protein